jgi:hypothetical protein
VYQWPPKERLAHEPKERRKRLDLNCGRVFGVIIVIRGQGLLFVVNLYQTDTRLVILAGDDHGVRTGSKTDRDR